MAAVEEPAHLDMGPVEVTPMVTLGVGHDDNVFRDNSTTGLKNKSSTVYQVDASAHFKAQEGLDRWEATLAAGHTRFASESDASYTDLGVVGDVHLEMNSRNRVDLNVDFGRYHDAGSTVAGVNNKEAPEFIRSLAGLKYGFGSMEAMFRVDLFGNLNKQTYKETDGAKEGNDRKTTEYGATAYYRFMPKTDALIEIKQRKLDYSDSAEGGYDINSYLVGLNWEATAKTTGYVKVGRRDRKAKASSVENEGYNGWEVGVSFMPVDYSVFQLSTSRDYGLESEDPQSADFTKGTSTALNWTHDWTGKISTRANYSHTVEDVLDILGVEQKDRTIKQLSLSVDWKVLRNATLSLSYENNDRKETVKAVGASDGGYRRNAYMLSGTMSL